MPKPLGKAMLDIRDSTPDWDAYPPDEAPAGSDYKPRFELTGGRIVKVVFDVVDDAYVDAERHLAAAMARD